MPDSTRTGGSELTSRLRVELERLRAADPFQVLGIPASADAAAVRAAFLELTKQFHPNRFARERAEVRDLANELFLVIRRAYEQLGDDERRQAWRQRISLDKKTSSTLIPGGAVPVPPSPTRNTPEGLPIPTRSATPPSLPMPPAAAIATMLPPRAVTPVSLPVVPPTLPPKAVTPPSLPLPPNPPRSTGTMPLPPMTGAPPSGPGTSGRQQVMGARPPAEVEALLDSVRTRGQRFDDACKLLAQGRYREAREALHKIAAEDPQAKRYRVHLHFAWGMEYKSEGRLEAAARELERSLALDPEFADASVELQKLQKQAKKSGIFSKLFGR